PGKAVADLLARPQQLLAGEPGARRAARPLDGLEQAILVLPRRARRDHRHGPVDAMLDTRADVVAEAEALADLLEEACVRIGAHEPDGERGGEDAARGGRRGGEPDQVALGEIAPSQAYGAADAARRQAGARCRPRAAGGKDTSERAPDARRGDAAHQGQR